MVAGDEPFSFEILAGKALRGFEEVVAGFGVVEVVVASLSDVPHTLSAGHIQLAPSQGVLIIASHVVPIPQVPNDLVSAVGGIGQVFQAVQLSIDAVVIVGAVVFPTSSDVCEGPQHGGIGQGIEIVGYDRFRDGDLSHQIVPGMGGGIK